MSDDAIDPKELQLSIREVLDAEAASDHVHKLYDSGALLDEKLAQTAANLGWGALGVAEEQGGLGLGLRGLAVLYEELGRVPAALPALSTQIVADAIAAPGSAQAQDAWLGRLLGGEVNAAWAAGDDGVALDAGRVSGTVRFVPDAAVAGLFLVTSGGKAALVAADAPGVGIEAVPLVDRTRTSGHVRFDGAEALALDVVDVAALERHAWLGIAWDSVGGGASILERTIEYLKVRTQFGQVIGSFQALKHRIADHKLRLETAIGIVREATQATSGDSRVRALAALAKATAADAYGEIADDAIQLHGGIGFTWEQDSHIFLKRARLNQTLYGSAEQLLDLSATWLTEAA